MDCQALSEELCQLHLAHARTLAGLRSLSAVQGEDGVLTWISQRSEATYAVDVARHFGLSAGRVANIVRSLESKAYIERHPEPDDMRRALISLTQAGQARASSLLADMCSDLRAILEQLEEEDADRLVGLVGRFLSAADSCLG